MMKKITLAITPGDPEGIGPEVTKKALEKLKKELRNVEVFIFGKKFPVENGLKITFIEPPSHSSPGFQSGWSIEKATKFLMTLKNNRALVTGPIHKERLQGAGYRYHGHTDFLAKLTRTKNVTMVLANDLFRVALVTNHCSIGEVPKKLTRKKLITTIDQVAVFCRKKVGVKKPHIAVLGLNPHAGENGLLGNEEIKVIIPAMKQINQSSSRQRLGVQLTGPHPADSFFAIEKKMYNQGKGHDFIIAQYHDQGLIPVKLSDFSNSFNLTIGLPFTRTSVDHGTAFDIAGKNKADPGSMIYAIRKAVELI